MVFGVIAIVVDTITFLDYMLKFSRYLSKNLQKTLQETKNTVLTSGTEISPDELDEILALKIVSNFPTQEQQVNVYRALNKVAGITSQFASAIQAQSNIPEYSKPTSVLFQHIVQDVVARKVFDAEGSEVKLFDGRKIYYDMFRVVPLRATDKAAKSIFKDLLSGNLRQGSWNFAQFVARKNRDGSTVLMDRSEMPANLSIVYAATQGFFNKNGTGRGFSVFLTEYVEFNCVQIKFYPDYYTYGGKTIFTKRLTPNDYELLISGLLADYLYYLDFISQRIQRGQTIAQRLRKFF